MIKPQHLNEWDKVAALTLSRWGPGSFPNKYEAWKKQLEEVFDVNVVEWELTLKDREYVYNHPELRAKDLMDALKDPSIKAIISSIGGEESIRLLPYIDFDVIKNNPKIFVWYSDSTVTHFMFHKAWVVSFYWPAIMAWFWENWWLFPYMVDSVKKTLFSNETIWEILPNKEWWTSEHLDWSKIGWLYWTKMASMKRYSYLRDSLRLCRCITFHDMNYSLAFSWWMEMKSANTWTIRRTDGWLCFWKNH